MHIINRLYSAEYDSIRKIKTATSRHIMIAATPRSGSTHFGIQCWRTGLLGQPLEYLRALTGGKLYDRLGSPAMGLDYWAQIIRLRTGTNGVFSYKMFVQDYGLIKTKFPDLLSSISPSAVLRIRRRDTAAQAVSYSYAIRSGAWFSDTAQREVDYDFKHILDCETSLDRQNKSWDRIFELTDTDPLTVFYEDLLSCETEVFRKVFDCLGMYWDGLFPVDLPSIRVQRNAQTIEWADRYRRQRTTEVEPVGEC